MFHVKRKRRVLGLVAFAGLSAVLLSGCIRDTSRGWAEPVKVENTQVVSVSKGKLSGIDASSSPTVAWTGTLSVPLTIDATKLDAAALSPSDTPFQGDLLQIDSELVRVRSLSTNGAQRELHLERGYGGTTAAVHAEGATVSASRRPWKFPDDWHILDGDARSLSGVYSKPMLGDDGIVYVGDYGGWLYAFKPSAVNLDAANDDQQPGVAVADLGDAVIGGVQLDKDAGMLYVTAGEKLFKVSMERMKSALEAGGGTVVPEASFVFEAQDTLWGQPAIEDDTVYVTSLDGHLYALDANSGSVKWSFDGVRSLATSPVIVGDVILAGGFDSTLFGVNKTSGELAWQLPVGNWILSTPVVDDDGTAYFGDFDGVLHAVNTKDGTEVFSLPLNRGKIRASMAISGDYVVVGTDDGWLMGVNRQTKTREWEMKVGSDILANLDTAGDEVLIAPQGCSTLPDGTAKTYYRAVDPATGALQRVEGVC
jgi:outer membrane protein assembly factor BamB